MTMTQGCGNPGLKLANAFSVIFLQTRFWVRPSILRFSIPGLDLISDTDAEAREEACRERLLRHLESADKGDPLELAKYSLERAGASASEMDSKQSPI